MDKNSLKLVKNNREPHVNVYFVLRKKKGA